MKRMMGLCSALLLVFGQSQAAVLDEARVVPASTAVAERVPEAVAITISTAGNYTLTVSDLGEISGVGDAFSSLYVVIHQGSRLVGHLAVPGNAATVTGSVTLAAGQYQVQVLGVTSGAGQYGVELRNGSALVWSTTGVIDAPDQTDYSALSEPLNLTAGRSYTLELKDHAFPAALSALHASIAQGSTLHCPIIGTAICTFTATDSSALLAVLATGAGAGTGLYGVRIVDNGTGAVIYGATHPVGDMAVATPVSLPAGDTYSLTSMDVGFPALLSSLRVALVQGSELLAAQNVVGSVTDAFPATAGTAELYVLASAASESAGLYHLQIDQGAATVFSVDRTVESAGGSVLTGHVFTVDLPGSGSYVLDLSDFPVPQRMASLSLAASQGGQVLKELSAAGTVTVEAVAGELSIAVLASPGTTGSGLFGLSVTPVGSAAALLEVTQGVGGHYDSRDLNLPQAARYTLHANDFSVPASLDNLILAITRGADLVGTIHATGGGSQIGFDALPGHYTLSVIAAAKSSAAFGMYGVQLVAAPTVNIAVSASSVQSGGSVTLTWNSTDADSCTASGGWSGSQPVSGSAVIGSITAGSSFTLTCAGPGGSTARTASVSVAPAPAGRNGGGAWSFGWLLGLAALAGLRCGDRSLTRLQNTSGNVQAF